MNLNVEETGPLERRLQVEVPTTEVDRAFDDFYRELRRSAQLKGFRKGRVPRAILERRFGQEARGEVLQTLIRDTLFRAIEQAELDIISEPRLDPEDAPTQGASFSYRATVEIRPEIELRQVEGLKLGALELPEPETDPVEDQLQELRERWADLIEEAEDVAAAEGHVAIVDFEGSLDGQSFEGGSGNEVSFEIGSGRAVAGFEQALVGLCVGEEKTFEIEFPEDYGAGEVAGRTAEFKVELRGLKRKQLPELDDELAKDVSEEFETFADLRAEVERRVEAERGQELQRLRRERAIEALIAANPFPLPESLVQAQIENLVHRMLHQVGDSLPQERREEMAGRWREEAREGAERNTALGLMIPRIAESREIQVDDAEVDARIGEIAERQGHSATELKRVYQEQDGVERLRAGLLEEKVIDFLLSKAADEED